MNAGPHRPAESNPFCTKFIQPGAMEFRFDDRQAACRIIDGLLANRFGLIIGPHGSGKSTAIRTLLPSLRDRFAEVVCIQTGAPTSRDLLARWNHRRRLADITTQHQRQLASDGLLIIDGIEQLSWMARFSLTRMARRRNQFILATSHARLSRFDTLYETKVTSDLVQSLAESLLAKAPSELSKPVLGELSRRDLTRLSNVRELWFELYDLVEEARHSRYSRPLLESVP